MAPATFVARSEHPEISARELWDWHLRPGAFERLTPPWEGARVVDRTGPVAEGTRVTLDVPIGPFGMRWVVRHDRIDEGRSFRDVQERGPFERWEHVHRFVERPGGGSILEDEIVFELPFGVLGRELGEGTVRERLRRGFLWRHGVVARDIERHHRAGARPLTVGITGSGGLIGSALSAFLTTGGHRVIRIVRRAARNDDELAWAPEQELIDAERLEGADAVVHLAGESIASGLWTDARKARIRDSRVEGTRLLARALSELSRPPRALVAASAIGYYGDRGDETLDETSPPGRGFLAETCVAWEAAARPAVDAGLRVAHLRTGLVVTGAGGALAPMVPLFKVGLGGRVGSGRQFVSWISREDLIAIYHRVLVDETLAGPINAVAPEPVRQEAFAEALARVLSRPTVVPAPAAAVRTALGEMGDELLLSSARVVPRRLTEAGFTFQTPVLDDALRLELGRHDDAPPGTVTFSS